MNPLQTNRPKSTTRIISHVLLITSCWALTVMTAFGATLFEENFENLTLGPNVDEAVDNANAWTDTAPTDWIIESEMPDGGVTEWRGWSFADPAWWTQTAEDQRRSEFTSETKLGGVIAIADPDEWDDKDDPDSRGLYSTSLSTPSINISGLPGDAVKLTFDSSWRPEDTQNASVTVSFDSGDPVEVLLMESQGPDPWQTRVVIGGAEELKPDGEQINESLTIDIPNPAGTQGMVITWHMFDAANDWWWAIDNIEVTTDVTTAVSPAGKLATHWATIKRRR